MISDAQLRLYIHQTRAEREIALQEVVLTYVLAALYQQPFSTRLAFKGGTALRKLLFGPEGRFSVDLDFLGEDISDDDVLEIGSFLEGLDFSGVQCTVVESRFTPSEPDEHGAPRPAGFSATVGFDCVLGSGRFEVDISRRRRALLPLQRRALVVEAYHRFLEFAAPEPLALAAEENIAEKISALARRIAHRNAKDVYDLFLYLPRPNDTDLLARLVALTLWVDRRDIGGSPEALLSRVQPASFDWEALRDILPNRIVEPAEVCTVVQTQLKRIFDAMDDDEQELVIDVLHHRNVGVFTRLREDLRR